MKHGTILLATVLLCLLFASAAFPQSFNYPAVLAPAGMMGPSKYISFELSKDGQYLAAATNKEVRCWKLPQGELVYMFQAGRERKGDQYTVNVEKMNCTVVNEFAFVMNSKYLRVRYRSCGQDAVQVAGLPGGELYKTGNIVDEAIAAVTDNYTYSLNKERLQLYNGDASVLKSPIPPDCFKWSNNVHAFCAVPDALQPGRNIIFYSEQLSCKDGYFKDILPKDEYRDKVLWKDRQGYKPNHFRFYCASVSAEGKEVRRISQLGKIWHGERNFQVDASPNGEYVLVREQVYGESRTDISLFNRAGELVWKKKGGPDYLFLSFGEYDHIWMKEGRNLSASFPDITAYVLFDVQTGKELRRIPYPKSIPGHKLIPGWNLMAVARNGNGETNSTISLHNAGNGEIVAILTDPQAVSEFATVYNKEQQRLIREEQERAEQQRKWAEQLIAWERKAKQEREERRLEKAAQDREANERYKADATTNSAPGAHARLWATCPRCSGRRGEQKTYPVYGGGSRTVYNTFGGGKTVFVDKSNVLYIENKFVPCDLCWGKGEVRR